MSSPSDVEAYGPVCPVDVAHPVMMHRWDTLTFLHWSYEPDVVARLLPVGLTLDTFDGKAWVGSSRSTWWSGAADAVAAVGVALLRTNVQPT